MSTIELNVGDSYVLQRSEDLNEWEDHELFQAESEIQAFELSQKRIAQEYYRLAW